MSRLFRPLRTWDYKFVALPKTEPFTSDILKHYGAEGWEAITVIERAEEWIFLLKRPEWPAAGWAEAAEES